MVELIEPLRFNNELLNMQEYIKVSLHTYVRCNRYK